jgi:hypothetical protein
MRALGVVTEGQRERASHGEAGDTNKSRAQLTKRSAMLWC